MNGFTIRAEVVTSMREVGMSTRAIASATGLGKGTVDRELATAPTGAVAEPKEETTTVEPGPAPVATVTGLNGKTYAAAGAFPVSDLT